MRLNLAVDANISDFEESLNILKTFVRFESEDFFNEFLPKAKELSPDINDATYFVLALKLGCSIWSNEKKLKELALRLDDKDIEMLLKAT